MPFIPNTPESLITRSDSKDPATTCKGLTASGRPCRRPLGVSPQASPTANRKSRNGVVAILEAEDDEHDGAAAFFCWQHQDQAETLTTGDQSGRRANIVPVQQRTSIDTLVDRLGVLDVEDAQAPLKGKPHRRQIRPARKETLPKKWQDVDGPLLAVNSGGQRKQQKYSTVHTPKRSSNLSLFCCIRSADSDPNPPPRIRKDSEKAGRIQHGNSKLPSSHQNVDRYTSRTNQGQGLGHAPTPRMSRPEMHNGRPSMPSDRPSQTEDFLFLIPKSLSPQKTALLLAELAKPVSLHDQAGFIYMFWLTDASTTTPEPQAASSLLADNLPSTPNGRHKSDIIQAHETRVKAGSMATPKATILLKIGRASNVQRRMNEWTRQCGHNLSLIRFYPHVSSASQMSASTPPGSPIAPSKVPCAHKIERLIHLELADQRVKRVCEHCSKEHREWFEVESSREGLKNIDGTIRRWTSWGQRMGKNI